MITKCKFRKSFIKTRDVFVFSFTGHITNAKNVLLLSKDGTFFAMTTKMKCHINVDINTQ